MSGRLREMSWWSGVRSLTVTAEVAPSGVLCGVAACPLARPPVLPLQLSPTLPSVPGPVTVALFLMCSGGTTGLLDSESDAEMETETGSGGDTMPFRRLS